MDGKGRKDLTATLYWKRFNKIKKVHDLVILGKDLNLPKKFLKMY